MYNRILWNSIVWLEEVLASPKHTSNKVHSRDLDTLREQIHHGGRKKLITFSASSFLRWSKMTAQQQRHGGWHCCQSKSRENTTQIYTESNCLPTSKRGCCTFGLSGKWPCGHLFDKNKAARQPTDRYLEDWKTKIKSNLHHPKHITEDICAYRASSCACLSPHAEGVLGRSESKHEHFKPNSYCQKSSRCIGR